MNTIMQYIIKLALWVTVFVTAAILFISSIHKAVANDQQHAMAAPKSEATITGEAITLGDVFSHITDQADFVLAPAPKPGVVLTWDARTLNRIATAFDLPWRGKQGLDSIKIRRLAHIIDRATIENEIIAALKKDYDLEGRFSLNIVTGSIDRVILPYDVEPKIYIDKVTYNLGLKKFTATLRLPQSQDRSNKLQLAGILTPKISIPTLKTTMRRGERIGRNDIAYIFIPETSITENMVIHEDSLIGMTPTKILSAKTPVNMAHLDKPILVDRGEMVMIRLSKGQINLTAMAKALERGTKGDTIRLLNTSSKRTLEAQITGLREAEIRLN